MGLVHLPSFVGRRGEASREQDSFVLAETGHFSQKLFHALAFFFRLKKRLRFWNRRVNGSGELSAF